MSNIFLPDEAIWNWAQSQIDNLPTLEGAKLHLYQSGLEITTATTLDELEAVQSTFAGYDPKLLANWSDAAMIGTKAMTEADPVSWEADEETEGTIYGVYATNGAGDRLLFLSTFSSPVPIPFGSELQVSIEVDFDSIFNL